MTAIYYLTESGNGYSSDGTLPPGAVECTQGQYENASEWIVSNGSVVAVSSTQKLNNSKDAQSSIIKQACADAIKAAFAFNAGGQTYTATLSTNDQANLSRNSAVALGVPTKAQPWTSDMTVPPRGICADGGEFYISMAGGTAGTTKPTWPTAFGTPVTDGTVEWELFGLQVDTTVGRVRVTYAEFLALFEQFSELMDSALGKCTALLNQIANATTQTAVKAVTW